MIIKKLLASRSYKKDHLPWTKPMRTARKTMKAILVAMLELSLTHERDLEVQTVKRKPVFKLKISTAILY